MKEGSPHPQTKLSVPLHIKPEGRKLAGEPPRLQEASTSGLERWFTLEPNTRQQHLSLFLSLSVYNLALTLTKYVLVERAS